MSAHVDLGNLCLSCPSTGLDLALTSNASFSTLAHCPFPDTLSAANIEAARVWIAPATNLHFLLNITWPSFAFHQHVDTLKHSLLTAFRHAALWSQLNLRPSLSIEPSLCQDTCPLIVISLTSPPLPSTGRKAPTHRLGKDVPSSHLKPPEGVPHWTLDQINLELDIRSPTQPNNSDRHSMPFEYSTLLGQAAQPPSPTDEVANLASVITLIDAAFRLAITNLSPKALSGVKITERASFKHLEDICPAMWSPGHQEAIASRTIFLPTISHAMSNSVQQRAHSFSLNEKLTEIARQEGAITSKCQYMQPQVIQKAVSIRLWRLMQRRLRDPAAGRGLESIKISDSTIPLSEPDHDFENGLDFEPEVKVEPAFDWQSDDYLELVDMHDDSDLLDGEYDSEWEDLFTDTETEGYPVDHGMLDGLHDQTPSELDPDLAADFGEMLQFDPDEEMIELEDCDLLHAL